MADEYKTDADFKVTHDCGCEIAFIASLGHKMTHYQPCDAHVNRLSLPPHEKGSRAAKRNELLRAAEKRLADAMQPPKVETAPIGVTSHE